MVGKKEQQLNYLCSSLSNYKVQIGTLELIKNTNIILVKFGIKYSFEIKVDLLSRTRVCLFANRPSLWHANLYYHIKFTIITS